MPNIKVCPHGVIGKTLCKACATEYRKKYYEENQWNLKKQNRQYYAKNKERAREYRREYYKKNKERIMEYMERYKARMGK